MYHRLTSRIRSSNLPSALCPLPSALCTLHP